MAASFFVRLLQTGNFAFIEWQSFLEPYFSYFQSGLFEGRTEVILIDLSDVRTCDWQCFSLFCLGRRRIVKDASGGGDQGGASTTATTSSSVTTRGAAALAAQQQNQGTPSRADLEPMSLSFTP